MKQKRLWGREDLEESATLAQGSILSSARPLSLHSPSKSGKTSAHRLSHQSAGCSDHLIHPAPSPSMWAT